MGNTGYKSFASLEKYYTDDNSYAGETKPNLVTDSDYIAPNLDTETCTPSTRFYNTVRTLDVIKNDCSSGYAGSTVTLTANANQFVSAIGIEDANAQADSWLNANAQVYANNVGVCRRNIFVATQSVIFENQDSDWSICKSATAADYTYTSNALFGVGLTTTFHLNRYRGIIDTSEITIRPVSAKIKFKFSTNNVGTSLTVHLFASSTQYTINQSLQLSDWNDFEGSSIDNVVVGVNSTAYNEIILTQNQIDLLVSNQSYDFFLRSNGDVLGSEPGTNYRPELSILESTGEVYLECEF